MTRSKNHTSIVSKTETKIVLEQKQTKLTPEQEEQLRIEESYYNEFESYGDVGTPKGYGPCLTYNPDCRCDVGELQRQRLVLENREIEERIRRENSENVRQERSEVAETNQLREELLRITVEKNELARENQRLTQELDEKINDLTQTKRYLQIYRESGYFSWEYSELEKDGISLEKFLQQHEADLRILKLKRLTRDIDLVNLGDEHVVKEWQPAVVVHEQTPFSANIKVYEPNNNNIRNSNREKYKLNPDSYGLKWFEENEYRNLVSPNVVLINGRFLEHFNEFQQLQEQLANREIQSEQQMEAKILVPERRSNN